MPRLLDSAADSIAEFRCPEVRMIDRPSHELRLAAGSPVTARVSARGKFLFAGPEKIYIRGVTYGPFRTESDGSQYHDAKSVREDFSHMRAAGINAVRIYTPPEPWLLDVAAENGLHVLVGLPWEQHITFLAEARRAADIEKRIRSSVSVCARHPAVLGYAIGNEIPSPIVRWYGHRRIQQYIERLYWAAKSEDPEGLVTYVNYPSTEYLELPCLDFVAFNVYLERRDRLLAYLVRLQNLAGDRPLVMGEIGLDSRRHGEQAQARTLEWQIETVFESGCAGLFVFSWTDEWHRGGHDIDDWQFGLTTRARRSKPALQAVRRVFQEVPFSAARPWPSISVVVCSFNGSRTLRSCLEGVQRLQYPNFEVVVVDDGSTDNTSAISSKFDVRVIRIRNGGLSNARNVGWQAATGEIVAYLDDDASPDPHWLTYLAATFLAADCAGAGGPNVAWPGDGLIAQCVDHAPGNPTHILLTDLEAEHLPGCNMAFRKSCLAEVGGFDTRFRIAGDDVDLCWRLQRRGWKLAFHPSAMVWHHRRGSLRGYWKQQLNYGRAEAMLERKWPEKYNAVGHATWNGRLYSKGPFSFTIWSRRRIYHGTWGSALFQSVYSLAPGTLASVLMLPEWYLVIAVLALVAACGALYAPLRYALPLLALAFLPPLIHAGMNGARAFFRVAPHSYWTRLKRACLTGGLHFLQPAARLWGRLCYGLTPWRVRGTRRLAFPWAQSVDLWSESRWQSAEERLSAFQSKLRTSGAAVMRGGEFDRWDLEVRGGLLGTVRLLMTIEEHGEAKQFVRMRLWPVPVPAALILAVLFAVLGAIAALDLNWTAWALLNVPAILLVSRTGYECAAAMAVVLEIITAEAASNCCSPEPAAPDEHRPARSAQFGPPAQVKPGEPTAPLHGQLAAR